MHGIQPIKRNTSTSVEPDKITIFSEPLMLDFPDPDELREQLRATLVHEIAHYFGMEESEIQDLGY